MQTVFKFILRPVRRVTLQTGGVQKHQRMGGGNFTARWQGASAQAEMQAGEVGCRAARPMQWADCSQFLGAPTEVSTAAPTATSAFDSEHASRRGAGVSSAFLPALPAHRQPSVRRQQHAGQFEGSQRGRALTSLGRLPIW